MTLREEILKNSGLLTEMPVIKKHECDMWLETPIGWWEVENNKELDIGKLNSKSVYNYILSGKAVLGDSDEGTLTFAKAKNTTDAIQHLNNLVIRCEIDDGDLWGEPISKDFIYKGEQAKSILHKLVSDLGDVKKLYFEEYAFNDKKSPEYKQNIQKMYDIVKNY